MRFSLHGAQNIGLLLAAKITKHIMIHVKKMFLFSVTFLIKYNVIVVTVFLYYLINLTFYGI